MQIIASYSDLINVFVALLKTDLILLHLDKENCSIFRNVVLL